MGICGFHKEFSKDISAQHKRIYMQFEWIGAKYQPVGEDSNDIFFLQHLPKVCKVAEVGHIIHRRISLHICILVHTTCKFIVRLSHWSGNETSA